MAVNSEVAIEGDSKGFNVMIVGPDACNADTKRGRIYAS